jgi:hypothetical protein
MLDLGATIKLMSRRVFLRKEASCDVAFLYVKVNESAPDSSFLAYGVEYAEEVNSRHIIIEHP